MSRAGSAAIYEFEMVDQMLEEFEYFADCVLDGRTPTPDGNHALADMRVMEAIYDSAAEEEPITV